MLKTLRIASFVIMILMLFSTIAIIAFGFKDNSTITAFLQSPNFIEQLRGNVGHAETQENGISPLVAQARAFSLRIEPPVPEDPIIVTRTKKEDEIAETGGKGSEINDDVTVISGVESSKFNLLATVLCKSSPEKSLALFRSGSKQEWFYAGETVDRYQIWEIKDGRVTLIQPGQKLREMKVPPKTKSKAFLKES